MNTDSTPPTEGLAATKAEKVLLQIRAAKNLKQLKRAVEAMWLLSAQAHKEQLRSIRKLEDDDHFTYNTPIC